MRKAFSAAMLALARSDERVVFLTGDLGYLAFEGLRDAIGTRFLNAGVAEQNMLSVAAGLAYKGFRPWVYSIAPFTTLRCLEQIRNDVCLHKLPVSIVANGGGFGYGVMGATHHAPEDIALMRSMPGMRLFLPTFASDVGDALGAISAGESPAYLRLNLEAPGAAPVPLRPWRRLREGSKLVLVTVGALAGPVLEVVDKLPPGLVEVYVLGELPCEPIPEEVVARIAAVGTLATVEEHYAAGGIGENLARCLLGNLPVPIKFLPLAAQGYRSGRYGSQRWHQEENGLAGAPLRSQLLDFLGTHG